jgi:PAS domain S-box-containing protein
MPESAFATALVAGLSDAVIHVNTEGRIQVWNAGAERIFGFTAAEAVGQTLDLIIPPSLRDRHNDGFAATMRTGHTKYGDGDILSVPALRKDGSRISVEFSIMRDVTARFEELRTLRRENAALRAGQR